MLDSRSKVTKQMTFFQNKDRCVEWSKPDRNRTTVIIELIDDIKSRGDDWEDMIESNIQFNKIQFTMIIVILILVSIALTAALYVFLNIQVFQKKIM